MCVLCVCVCLCLSSHGVCVVVLLSAFVVAITFRFSTALPWTSVFVFPVLRSRLRSIFASFDELSSP